MRDPLIAVLGGYGAVGATAVRRLAALGHRRLRVGGRSRDRAAALCAEVPGAQPFPVDAEDPRALREFCVGSQLVVNCAGPSYRLLDTVARAARAVGAHYVDAAGDLPAHRALLAHENPDVGGHTALFSAGVTPGLTGLLPRLIAGPGDRLDAYVGGAVRITPASAIDILLAQGPDFGEPMASWRHGQVAPRTLAPRRRVQPTGFPEPVDAMPYLTAESARLAAHLGLAELRAHAAYPSDAIPTALALAWADDPRHLPEHAAALTAAASADLRDRTSYYVLAFQARTARGVVRSLTLRIGDPYHVSGLTAALAAHAVLADRSPPGAHFAADVLDPWQVMEALRGDPLVHSLDLTSSTAGIP
ncbi:saccharopine dehydrogenase NADP-binding domain-containing protein [Streptomyces sp. PT12]|uniref:saccharopine dehydrogenase NADP-binding domain-containing protein n=1 Tax=Streptomyces sp. PT12 TaxID=1510197 RepID=UPI000DE1DBD0|nr:saccharopine dehydrogenase NADP-binding domain-containing protein [Streptomyces sp. PT12]RBM06856.1 saccharopine dehydrogenase [Streptomyces sp. PT12]